MSVASRQWCASARTETYLAADDKTDAVRDMVDYTVDDSQIVGGHANRANEEMVVTTTRQEQVEVLVVHLRPGNILDLGTERIGNVVIEGCCRDRACRANGGPGEQGRDGSPVDHCCC